MLRDLLRWIMAVWNRMFGRSIPIVEAPSKTEMDHAKLAFEREMKAALGADQELKAAADRLRENRERRQEALRKLEET